MDEWQKKFEKINIKIEISNFPLYQMSVNLKELQILGPNLPKNMNQKSFEKTNIKTVIRI